MMMSNTATAAYASGAVKRARATAAEMDERRQLLRRLAERDQPASVRHLFYAAVVAEMPGITKTKSGYLKIQRLALEMRRSGELPYEWVVDNTRLAQYLPTWDSPEEALADMHGAYRRDLWRRSPYHVEIWCEADSIFGSLWRVASAWRVRLMICHGHPSETFLYEAAQEWRESRRQPVVLFIGDHDPAGLEIEQSALDKLATFSERQPHWRRIGVTWDQVEEYNLPGTTPKKPYGYPKAVEAEALPAPLLRELVDQAVQEFVDHDELEVLRVVEEEERRGLELLAGRWGQ
jgi:hypothetical protein